LTSPDLDETGCPGQDSQRSARDEAVVGCSLPRTVAHKGEILVR
jgi:hypothetical protein